MAEEKQETWLLILCIVIIVRSIVCSAPIEWTVLPRGLHRNDSILNNDSTLINVLSLRLLAEVGSRLATPSPSPRPDKLNTVLDSWQFVSMAIFIA